MVHAQRAFTLIELSIVIVIIGLLFGSVLVGQSIYKGQQLRTVMTDATKYAVATQQFKQKFNYLPGDFPSATRIWPKAMASVSCVNDNSGPWGVNDITTPYPVGTVCDGNGDGLISSGAINKAGELTRIWPELAAAKMISGTFTGITGTATSTVYRAKPGINIPAGVYENTGYAILAGGDVNNALSPNSLYFDGDYSNTMTFGRPIPNVYPDNTCAPPPAACAGTIPVNLPVGTFTPALNGQQAHEIDEKSDDGSPDTGKIRTFKYDSLYAPYCAVQAPLGGITTYRIDNAYEICSLIFMNTYALTTP